MDLSVIIISFNEEVDLPGCLESIQSLDPEIVVVDNHSHDHTIEIAKKYGAKVYSQLFEGYAPQKQFALNHATRRWVLSIDCDERVSPELANELRTIVEKDPPEAGFDIPFEIHYLGRKLRFGGMGSEHHVRLFRRDQSRFIGGKIHEGVEVRGTLGRLRGRIQHFPYRDLAEHRQKIERYTTLMAERRIEEGQRPTAFHRLIPFWEFFLRYFLRFGILDGKAGLAYAYMAATYTRMKYEKMIRLHRDAA